MEQTRRDFVWTGAAGVGGGWLAMQLPAIEAAAAYARQAVATDQALEVLTEEEARELEAIASRIIPTDDTPGAREAGVIQFMDRAFATFQAPTLPMARQGLAELETRVRDVEPDLDHFSELEEPRQDELLREIETGGFFGLIRYLTVVGMFALPEYGGNRDQAGWRLLGFDDRYRWLPPFGYYDAEASDG